jgi:hypothetical protein
MLGRAAKPKTPAAIVHLRPAPPHDPPSAPVPVVAPATLTTPRSSTCARPGTARPWLAYLSAAALALVGAAAFVAFRLVLDGKLTLDCKAAVTAVRALP